jgi:hypothetical protein
MQLVKIDLIQSVFLYLLELKKSALKFILNFSRRKFISLTKQNKLINKKLHFAECCYSFFVSHFTLFKCTKVFSSLYFDVSIINVILIIT